MCGFVMNINKYLVHLYVRVCAVSYMHVVEFLVIAGFFPQLFKQ